MSDDGASSAALHPSLADPRLARLAPFAAGAIVLAFTVAVQSAQPVGTFWDDGVYLITARSLASGEGYRFAHLPGAPPAVHYPPGWPALLAAVWRLLPGFPDNAGPLLFLNPLLASVGAAMACAYGVRRLRLHHALAVAAAVVFATTLPVLVLDGVLFAEPLFLVVTIATLFAADAAARDGDPRRAAVSGLLAGLATLVRSIGIVLVPAIVLALVLERRVRAAAVAAAMALACIVPWQVWVAAHAGQLAPPLRGNYGPYSGWLAAAVRERGVPWVASVVWRNVNSIERSFAVIFFPVGLRPVRPLLVVLLLVLTLLGGYAVWRRSRTFCLFAVGYAAVVACWPYAPDRFAWAVWPLAGLLVAGGASEAWRYARHRAAPAGVRAAATVMVALATVAGGGLAFYSMRGISRGWVDGAQRRNAERLAPVVDWVNANTGVNDVVACDGEPFVNLHTGRRVVPVHALSADEYLAGTALGTAVEDLQALIVAGGADFAVFSAGTAEIQAAELLSEPGNSPRLVPMDTLPGGGVAFRVIRTSGPPPDPTPDSQHSRLQ